jgi:hypothetical protein
LLFDGSRRAPGRFAWRILPPGELEQLGDFLAGEDVIIGRRGARRA